MFNSFKDALYQLAKTDKRIVFIIVDQDIGLGHMEKELPGQYFMEGISEANTIGVASGLAADGMIPFVVNHASFGVRRGFEQIVLDACLQERPIRIIGMGGGVATAHLGPTHTTLEDIAIMRALPEMTVIAPCDAAEMKRLTPQLVDWPKSIYLRLGRYGKPIVSSENDGTKIGKAVMIHQGEKPDGGVLLLTTGVMTACGVAVAKDLKNDGVSCSVLHLHTIKPIDAEAIVAHARSARLIVTLEDHLLAGGFGSACLEALMDTANPKELPRVVRMGFPDKFIHEYGSQDHLLKTMGLDAAQVAANIRKLLEPALS